MEYGEGRKISRQEEGTNLYFVEGSFNIEAVRDEPAVILRLIILNPLLLATVVNMMMASSSA